MLKTIDKTGSNGRVKLNCLTCDNVEYLSWVGRGDVTCKWSTSSSICYVDSLNSNATCCDVRASDVNGQTGRNIELRGLKQGRWFEILIQTPNCVLHEMKLVGLSIIKWVHLIAWTLENAFLHTLQEFPCDWPEHGNVILHGVRIQYVHEDTTSYRRYGAVNGCILPLFFHRQQC